MNYKGKYEQIKKAYVDYKSQLATTEGNASLMIAGAIGALESLFPELKESKDERIKNEIIAFVEQSIHRGGGTPIPEEQESKWIAWLEKQGESIKIEKGKNYLCTKTHKYAGLVWIKGIKYYSPEDYSLVGQGCTCYCPKYSKEEHNNSFKEVGCDDCLEDNKTEPKFHKGDWIVDDIDTVYQIKEIKKDRYLLQFYNSHDVVSSKVSTIDNDCHLWTIKDAKDGDVLVHNGCTFIFMGIKNGIVQALEEHFLDGTNPVCFGEPDKDGDYHPATKEQRDTLTKAMADAGYTFDFEKKELKEIEPAKWSEDDNLQLQAAIDICKSSGHTITSDWLKSLKERVQPQPKQEWKPSDEQMKALHDINLTGNISYAGQGQTLIELYNDLKKL